ncbi:MAG: hypothetical protein KF789_00335 [Bdellovibrionaceae bacterium]|nr:hypothetical protein [Pseudobdellovibrionaceae bacterium]
MELKEHKLEIGIAILCVLLITGLFRVFGSFFSSPRIEVGNISYEMPRPKSDIVGEFGLGDREIDRRYKNPFDQKGKADERKPLAANVKQAAAPAQAARKAAGQWMALRAPQHSVRVIDRAANKGLTGSDFDGNGSAPVSPNGTQKGQAGAPTGDEKKDKLSAAQWVALMNAQPTRENMQKFVAAYKAGEVDPQSFYSVINGMLDKQNQEQQLLALYGLEMAPEAAGFVAVAQRISSMQEGEAKTQATAYLQSFGAPTRHSSLMVALKNENPTVQYYAAWALQTGLSNTQDPRNGRDENTVASTSYQQFVPIFQEMLNSNNEQVRSIANDILGLLQQTTA